MCFNLFSTNHTNAQTEKHQLKIHLIKTKYDTITIPAIWKYNRRHTDSTLKRAALVLYKNHKHADSVFLQITIKVYENGDTTSVPIHTFGPISKASLNFTNSSGTGFFELTGLTASRKKMTACVYRDSEDFIAFKQDFHIMSALLKPLPETPTHPSVIAQSPEPPILDLPIATMLPYMGSSFSHLETGGWFLCDGRAISSLNHMTEDEKTELITLFTASGNPNPNNLPDLRGYFLRGVDGGSGNDPDHSSRTGSGHRLGGVQNDAFRSHNHTQDGHTHSGTTSTDGNHNHGGSTGEAGYERSDYGIYTGGAHVANNVGSHSHSISTDGAHSHSLNISGASNTTIHYNGSNETRPKNIGVNYIIKVRR